jgi:hypothetical protein
MGILHFVRTGRQSSWIAYLPRSGIASLGCVTRDNLAEQPALTTPVTLLAVTLLAVALLTVALLTVTWLPAFRAELGMLAVVPPAITITAIAVSTTRVDDATTKSE